MLDQVEEGQKPALLEILEKRLGRVHAKLRLGIEADHEAEMLERKLSNAGSSPGSAGEAAKV